MTRHLRLQLTSKVRFPLLFYAGMKRRIIIQSPFPDLYVYGYQKKDSIQVEVGSTTLLLGYIQRDFFPFQAKGDLPKDIP